MAGEFKREVNAPIRTITGPLTCAAPPTTSPERSQGGVQQIPGKVRNTEKNEQRAGSSDDNANVVDIYSAQVPTQTQTQTQTQTCHQSTKFGLGLR
jgi:hypothetical protein